MLYTIHNEKLSVTIRDLGAELQSIRSCDGTEYLWQGDPKYWSDRALNIFPFVARLTEGSYYLDGKRYDMDIHGFAPYQVFSVENACENSITFLLEDYEELYFRYPRHFAFRITYTLQDNRLDVIYQVESRDQRTMYFGLGGHPGFCVPLSEGEAFEDYRLRFGTACEPKRVGFTPACYLDGTDAPFEVDEEYAIPLRHDLFDDDAIVLKDVSREVVLESVKGSRSVTVRFPQMPYLGIWHWPKTDAPYVCIEPWCSLPAEQDVITEFEKRDDLIRLESGKCYENRWSISVT